MNLMETLTKEEWDFVKRWYVYYRDNALQPGYAMGDSRKPKIVKNWAQNYRYSKIIDDEYCEYKKADPRFKQRVKR